MADIINSVDRSPDMYIYDLYIYRYISLSIYLSVYLSLSILVGRHLCQRGASRQQKPTSCRYDTYKAFKFIAWCKAAPHNLRLSSFFCSGRSRTESSQTWEPWRNTRSPPVARSHHQCVVRSNRPEGLRSSAVAKLRDCQEARKSKIASRLGKAILFQATEEGLNSSAPLSAPPLNHAPAVWAQRCGAGGCRREATWILGDLWNVPNAPPRCFIFFIFFAEYWLCKYRETTIHAKQWKIPKVSKVSAVALRGSSRMYPSVSIFFDRPCPIVFSQIVANLNIYHSIRNILWQILNWYDLISIIFNFPFKSPKMVLTISSSLLITGPPRRLARRGRRPRGRQRKMVTFPGSGWGSQSERRAFGVFFGAWGLVLSPIAVIYNYNIYIYMYIWKILLL